ncbi:INO80 complex subunit B, partial [Stegodyphus mimosarum]
MKDPNLMTARQRSLLESKAQKEKEEIVPVVPETKVLSEEMIQKKIMKAKKRKEQAEEKREKDKKQTIERLLKKSDKPRGVKKTVKKSDVPKVKYIDHEITGRSLSFPPGFQYPLKPQAAKEPPPVILCGVKGCENKKKYSCSKTGVPLCS